MLGQVQTFSSTPVTNKGHSVYMGGAQGNVNKDCICLSTYLKLLMSSSRPLCLAGLHAILKVVIWLFLRAYQGSTLPWMYGVRYCCHCPVSGILMSWPLNSCLSIASTQIAVQTVTFNRRRWFNNLKSALRLHSCQPF